MKTTFLASMLLAAALPLSAMAQTPATSTDAAPAKSAKATPKATAKAPASSKHVKAAKVQPRQGKHRVVRPVMVKKVR